MKHSCTYHPTRSAHWECPKCRQAFCAACVITRQAAGQRQSREQLHLCPVCRLPAGLQDEQYQAVCQGQGRPNRRQVVSAGFAGKRYDQHRCTSWKPEVENGYEPPGKCLSACGANLDDSVKSLIFRSASLCGSCIRVSLNPKNSSQARKLLKQLGI